MQRREFLKTGASAPLLQGAAKKRPNILLFCTDQQRFDTIGALGNPYIRTPHLDALAARGVAFENAYCQTPICTPSRASMLTGCYASSLHVNRNGNEYFPKKWEPRLVSRILAAAGYDNGMVGKFHLSSSYRRVEPRLNDGYRFFEWSHAPRADWPVEQNGYLRWLRGRGVDFNAVYGKKQLPGRPAQFNAGMPAAHHETAWCAETAADWIRGGLGKPWFITVNTYAPHPPFHPPLEFLERVDAKSIPPPLWRPSCAGHQAKLVKVDFQSKAKDPSSYPSQLMKAAYYAQIEFVDHQFGRVVEALKTSGQLDDTLIAFVSDHGETLGDHGLTHKGCRFYEGLSHVPLIVSWPKAFAGGRRSAALVELTDIVPTLLDAAGLEKPAYLHGKSLMPILQSNAGSHRAFVRSEYHDALDLPDASHANMIRDERYKIVCYHGHETGELFDLKDDPGEFTNLWHSAEHQQIRFALMKRMFDEVMLATDPGQPRVGPM